MSPTLRLSVGAPGADGTPQWTFPSKSGLLCAGEPMPPKEVVWRDAPHVLEHLLAELFDAQPSDALSWLHEAAWRYYSKQLGQRLNDEDLPPLPGGEELVVQLPSAIKAPVRIKEEELEVGTEVPPPMEKEEPQPPPADDESGPEQPPPQEQPAGHLVAQPRPQRQQEREEQPPVGHVRTNVRPRLQRIGSAPLAPDSEASFEAVTTGGLSGMIASLSSRRRGGRRGRGDAAAVSRSASNASSRGGFAGARRFFRRCCGGAGSEAHDVASATSTGSNASGLDDHVDRGVLPPMSQTRFLWDFVFFICLLYELWSTPLDFAFNVEDTPLAQQVVGNIVAVVFVVDILVNFNTGYIDGDRVIMRRRAIASNYFFGWFWIDVLATVPDIIMAGVMSFYDQFSSIRILRTMKFYKLLKALRLVRSLRLLRTQSMANKVLGHFNMSSNSMFAGQLVQGHIMLIILIHFNAVLWAAFHPEWNEEFVTPFGVVIYRYGASLARVYRAMTFGEDMPRTVEVEWTPQELIAILIGIQRATIFVLVSAWITWRMMCVSAREASDRVAREMVVGYLKHHRVSTGIQLKVFQTLNEATMVRRQQEHFNRLAVSAFPPQLRQTVCYELWSQRLMTMDIILEIANWEGSFIKELTLAVHEQVIPSKVILFSVGEPSDAAYLLLRGALVVTYHEFEEGVPDFSPGMWVGEKGLVNPRLRRSQTIVCKVLSQLMSVPSEAFHRLLGQFELKDRFTRLLNERLWLGLCGRCGALGDHYSSSCPMLKSGVARQFIAANNPASGAPSISRRNSSPEFSSGWLSQLKHRIFRSQSMAVTYSSESERSVSSSELQHFLLQHNCGHLFKHMGRHGILSLSDLNLSAIEAFRADPEVQLTQAEEKILSETAVDKFRRRMRNATSKFLENSEASHHFVFISHYKAEAGTTASLMQDMLSRMLRDNSSTNLENLTDVCSIMEAPVFLDSEDLKDLSDLKRHVTRSHNIVLLLTQGVLKRPWCLLEIVTAHRSGAHVLPVKVEEPGCSFDFPDEAFYERLLSGQVLDRSCMRFLQSEGIDAEELAKVLKLVFQRIAVPFSPHKTANIRSAELGDLLKECTLRPKADAGAMSDAIVVPSLDGRGQVDVSRDDSVRTSDVAESLVGHNPSNASGWSAPPALGLATGSKRRIL